MRYLLITCVLIVCSCAATTEQERLIFEDEFLGSELNTNFWSFEYGDGCPEICGWGNEEQQFYTDKNYSVQNGFLVITAKQEDSLITSTRIKTQDKFNFQYGTVEMRAKLPKGKGTWPAFWLLGENIREVGWPLSGEIDIMEFAGKDPHLIHHTLHTQSSHGASENTFSTNFPSIDTGFHTYKAKWTANSIKFFVNNELQYTYSPEQKNIENWPFDQPFFILINFAVGGHFGGHEVDESIFPQEYIIDYVKVWQ